MSMATAMTEREPLVPGEHVLIITQDNPHVRAGGSAVIVRNLVSAFDPRSYTVAYLGRFARRGSGGGERPDCYRLVPNFHPVQLFGRLSGGIKLRYAVRRAVRLARSRKARIVVGLYPTLNSLHVATEVARRTGARYVPYLHDTVAEGLAHTPRAEAARALQDAVFRSAERILTMSRGMSDYYRDAYGLETYPLEHSYPEEIASEPSFGRSRSAFWGGDVYAINDRSFARVQEALAARETELEVATRGKLGLESAANVRQSFYASRQEYIRAVRNHGILVLALNWPDESAVHEAELSTIFPTKTIEYLATGSPILVHCPEHYFLARFFRQHDCGVVVSERSEAALAEGIELLQSGGASVRGMQQNALAATELFSLARVSALFRSYLSASSPRIPN